MVLRLMQHASEGMHCGTTQVVLLSAELVVKVFDDGGVGAECDREGAQL